MFEFLDKRVFFRPRNSGELIGTIGDVAQSNRGSHQMEVLELLIWEKYFYMGLIVEGNKTTTDLRHVPKINRLGMKRSKSKDPMMLFGVSKEVSDANEDSGEINHTLHYLQQTCQKSIIADACTLKCMHVLYCTEYVPAELTSDECGVCLRWREDGS